MTYVPRDIRAALSAPPFHATTANALDGYDVVETFGVVRGITVRSRSLFGTLGANALIALRYDATEIMSGVSEVLCYGTAVRVAPRAPSPTPR